MDLPCIEWQKRVQQKWNRLTPDQNQRFVSLLDIDEIFDFGLSQVSTEDTEFLSSISNRHPIRKDPEQATRCKEKGNASFKARDYTAASLLYSQGVCHASMSSEQLSLCYANRSAALFHLQLYKECLDNIDMALKHGYPGHLQHKLQSRRTQCLNHLPRQGAGVNDEGVFSGTGQAKLPDSRQHENRNGPVSCLSPRVSVCFSPEKGRHLVATEGIAAGEVIVTDCAYSCVLIPGMEGGGLFGTEEKICHLCLREGLSPLPCEGCCYARYCSEGCRRAAWEWHHRWECPIGAELRAAGVMSQLALRVGLKAGLEKVLKARGPTGDKDSSNQPVRDELCINNASSKTVPEKILPEEDSDGPSARYHGDCYLSIYHLQPHPGGHAPSLRYLWSITVATLCLQLSKTGPPTSWKRGGACENKELHGQVQEDKSGVRILELSLLGSVVLRHLLQLQCNAQAVSRLRDTGELSAVQSSQEEVLHCYGPHSSRMGLCERRRLLQEQYLFLCNCPACCREQGEGPAGGVGVATKGAHLLCGRCHGPVKQGSADGRGLCVCTRSSCGLRLSYSELDQKLQKVKVQLQQAVDLLETDKPDQSVRLLQKTASEAAVFLTETHPVQGQLADALARAYATMGEWQMAAAQLERSVVAICSQYGEDSIEVGRQLFKLAQLHFNGGCPGPSLSVIPRARRLLSLHSGPQCPEVQELQAMEDCLQGAL
ncbi:hypothetical protein DPEC_G00228660 [Dallia pectoralis]|uniref:Uncharacterized protein n=1 Tax=Dallia pectoralis TaxID=75939 RepID=A0ACC2G1C5_DALPE|nr:hypothetical protein DPEC_G00228660 [Dallia pectoralis]